MKNPNYSIPAAICLLAIMLFFPYKVTSQDAEFIFNEMRAMQLMRWEGVRNYTITLSIRDAAGMETSTYHERMEEDGQVMFREVPRPLYEREMHMAAGFPPPEDIARELADGYELLGPVLAQNGYPMGGMMLQGAGFLRAAADATESISDGKEEARDELTDWEQFKARARMIGTEQVIALTEEKSNGQPIKREAYHIMADGLSDIAMDQTEDGGEFTLERVDLWVDAEQMVPLLLKMQGNMERDNTVTPLTISKLDLDYKHIGSLYESHTKVFRLSGMMKAMSPKEQRKMEKSMAELERAKEQLANMTPEEKAMMEKMGMMGKMEQLEKMMGEDKIESIVDVTSIAINDGPPAPYGMGSVGMQPALTIAGEGVNENGELVAELVISVGPNHAMEMVVGLVGKALFPLEGGESVLIVDASGHVVQNGKKVSIDGASGNIIVSHRSQTQIKGTYNATLQYDGGVIPINGNFNSGVPVGPDQPPRGSPIPGWFRDLE